MVFAADRVFLYGRQNILSGTYLNDIQRQSSRFINPKPVRELLEDKLLFGTLVGPIARVPVNYLYADHGSTVVVSAEWHDIASCRTGKVYRLVNKRARGGGGGGIRFLEISQGIVRFSGREVELSAFVRSFAGQKQIPVVSVHRAIRLLSQNLSRCHEYAAGHLHARKGWRALCRQNHPKTRRAAIERR